MCCSRQWVHTCHLFFMVKSHHFNLWQWCAYHPCSRLGCRVTRIVLSLVFRGIGVQILLFSWSSSQTATKPGWSEDVRPFLALALIALVSPSIAEPVKSFQIAKTLGCWNGTLPSASEVDPVDLYSPRLGPCNFCPSAVVSEGLETSKVVVEILLPVSDAMLPSFFLLKSLSCRSLIDVCKLLMALRCSRRKGGRLAVTVNVFVS